MFECWEMKTWRIFDTFMAASEGLPPMSFLTELKQGIRSRHWLVVRDRYPESTAATKRIVTVYSVKAPSGL